MGALICASFASSRRCKEASDFIGAGASASLCDAISVAISKGLFYGYYGAAHFDRNVAIDPSNGQQIGFGYEGSPSNHNRTIEEASLGYNHTFFRDPAYGAAQLMLQYSHVSRAPWSVAPGQPADASMNMLFIDFRYTFPGAPPAPK